MEFQETLNKLYGDGEFSIIKLHTSLRDKIVVKHKCGRIVTLEAAYLKKGKFICNCNPLKRQVMWDEQEVKLRLPNDYTLVEVSDSKQFRFDVKHETCGTVYNTLAINFFNKNSRCQKCNGTKKLEESDIIDRVNEREGYKFVKFENNSYSNIKGNFIIKHDICNSEFPIRIDNFINLKQNCPVCRRTNVSSKNTLLIEEFLNENKINYSKEFTDSRCRLKNLLRFDYMIPLNGRILLLEYNGEQHYKTGKSRLVALENQIARDKVKLEFVEKHSDSFSLEIIRFDENLNIRLKEIVKKFLISTTIESTS